MECFTANFLRFFTEKRQNLAFGWTAGYLPSNPRISGIFLKFIKFARYDVCNVIFRKKKILKGKAISITENLTKKRITEMRAARETYDF